MRVVAVIAAMRCEAGSRGDSSGVFAVASAVGASGQGATQPVAPDLADDQLKIVPFNLSNASVK